MIEITGWQVIAVFLSVGGVILGFAIAMWHSSRSTSKEVRDTKQTVGRVEGEVGGINKAFEATQHVCHKRMQLTERRLDTAEKRVSQNERRLTNTEKRLTVTEKRLRDLEGKREE